MPYTFALYADAERRGVRAKSLTLTDGSAVTIKGDELKAFTTNNPELILALTLDPDFRAGVKATTTTSGPGAGEENDA